MGLVQAVGPLTGESVLGSGQGLSLCSVCQGKARGLLGVAEFQADPELTLHAICAVLYRVLLMRLDR